MQLKYHVLTHQGPGHRQNEDTALVFIPSGEELFARKGALFLVADGVGGHAAGEVASRLAAETIRDIYYSSPQPVLQALEQALRTAHQRVVEEARQKNNNMATTATAFVCLGTSGACGHVGNTRLYLWRKGELTLLTLDHTLVAELVARGAISSEQALSHPQRHVLTQALGIKAEPFVQAFALEKGDRLMLCSDGLHEVLDEQSIQKLLGARGSPKKIANKLLSRVVAKGPTDDTTLIVIRLG